TSATVSSTAELHYNIDIDKTIFGFDDWSSSLPSASALHCLAVWEIFHAHTEASMDGKILTPQAMFARWRQTIMPRIIYDFYAHHALSSSTFQEF
ncbi:hypothetical protein EV175_001188, partial [Coemansia sp. RSA 1933]